MKKFLLSVFFWAVALTATYAQTTVRGTVIDSLTKEPLPGASIVVKGSSLATSAGGNGSFSLNVSGSGTVTVSFIGYESREIRFSAGSADLGTISLKSGSKLSEISLTTNSVAIDRKTPVAVSTIRLETIVEKGSNQEFPELLKSTPGIYATKTGGGFGDSRVNVRGFSAQNVAVLVNGVPVNDMENGQVYWSNWAGLIDVTRSMQVQRGLGASKVAVPSIGGTINVQAKTTDMAEGGAIFGSLGNDGYVKSAFTYSTGLTKDNWAFSVAGSKTSGRMWAEGTEFVGYNYFFNISKNISEKHALSFTGFGAPQRHGQRQNRQSIDFFRNSPQGLKTNTDYGIKNGKVVDVEDNFYHKPQFSLNHIWTINESSSLSTAAYYSFGHGGGGAYTGTLPRTGDQYSPYDLDAAIDANVANPSGAATSYLRASRNDHEWYGVLSTYKKTLTDNIDLLAGLDLRSYTGKHFTEVTDVLGAAYVLDNSDVNNPNRKTKVGDKITYYNDGKVKWTGGFLQAEYSKDKLSAFVSGSLSNSSYQRIDYYLYTPGNQKTPWVDFLGYMAKGGATYNLSANHFVFGNLGYFEKAPYNTYVFLNNTNVVNPVAKDENVTSFELGYGYRSKSFTANLNAYKTSWNNRSLKPISQRDPTTGLTRYANINGVNEDHIGIELEALYSPSPKLRVNGMFSIGDWHYTNNVENVQVFDENNVALGSPFSVYLENVKVGDAAQTTAALGLNYSVTPTFKIGADWNYFGDNYASFVPENRTIAATASKVWKVPNYSTLDANARFSFKLGTLDADFFANVNNLLGTEYISDANDGVASNAASAAVFYGFGTTWTTGLKLKF